MTQHDLLTLEQLNQNRDILTKIFDVVRVVDPSKKKTFVYNESNVAESESHCYALWSKNKICSNCIAMRAFVQKDTFFKLEYDAGRIFMITAVPVQDSEGLVILESLKTLLAVLSLKLKHRYRTTPF